VSFGVRSSYSLRILFSGSIAVFAAISKAALILPVSEAVGQLKWIWFRKERTLSDFYAFDNASRGPWGSAMLLRTTKLRQAIPAAHSHRH
jgi:hypothetical protein